MNGWQNVSETNADKALGVRLDYAPGRRVALAYAAFLGNEQPDSLPRRVRVFQEGVLRLEVSPRLGLIGTVDYGVQRRHSGQGRAAWRGFSLVGRYRATRRLALGARAERYSDPEQVVVATGTSSGLRASGGSLNLDVTPHRRLLWRTELRALTARSRVFPARDADGGLQRSDVAIVSSLALTF